MNIVILGLSITSSWGNGHATTFRGLVRELDAQGHRVTFLERDVPWYAEHRDLACPPYGRTHLYGDLDDLRWALNFYGYDAVRVIFLLSADQLDNKSRNFWRFFFSYS